MYEHSSGQEDQEPVIDYGQKVLPGIATNENTEDSLNPGGIVPGNRRRCRRIVTSVAGNASLAADNVLGG
jgi:hypothetical protein